MLLSEVTERNLAELCPLLESEPDLKVDVRNLGVPSLKTWGPKTAYLWASSARISSERNALETNKKLSYKGSFTFSQNLVNFGL